MTTTATRSILLATPDRDWSQLLKIVLESQGFQFAAVATGRDLVSGALSHVPDVLVIDTAVADLSSEDILKSLQALGATRAMPVVLLVRDGGDLEGLTAFRAGRDQILQKPFTREALLRTLDRAAATTLTGAGR